MPRVATQLCLQAHHPIETILLATGSDTAALCGGAQRGLLRGKTVDMTAFVNDLDPLGAAVVPYGALVASETVGA